MRLLSRLLLPLAAALCCAAAPASRPLTEQEQAGKRIYLTGESPSGSEITALVGQDAILPGSALPCGTCHGEDGRGRPEGGVTPSEITWRELSKPYGHVHPDGRKHPVFNEQNLARTIREGVDPANNALNPAMPRYALSTEDMASLVAYLRRLGTELDPGLGDAVVRVGTVLPLKGALGEMGQALQRVLAAYFDELNAAGGLHGRRVELVVVEYDREAGAGLQGVRRQLTEAPVFALLSGLVPGLERELAALAEDLRVPLVGPLTHVTLESAPVNRFVFFVQAGLREQAGALAEHAMSRLGLQKARGAILHPEDEPLAEAARTALERFQARGWKSVQAVSYPRGRFDPAVAERLKKDGAQFVLFLGSDAELAALTQRAQAGAWRPYLLVPGTLAARALVEAPASFKGRLFLAYPALPSDEKPRAAQAFGRLEARAQTGGRFRNAQVTAYTAAAVLSEGLRRAGKELSREVLIGQLEKFYGFDSGLLPPVSYGPNRRVGARGAYVVTVDLPERTFRPVGGWVSLTDP